MLGFPEISMAEIRRLYQPGPYRHWFDPDTMRFFGTVLPGYGVRTRWGNFFITAETSPGDKRRYSLRRQDPVSGDISTVGEFHACIDYRTARGQLRHHLERLIAEDRETT